MPYTVSADGELQPLRRSPEEVISLIRKENIRFIDLQFADVPGRLQHTTIPTMGSLELESFTEGIPKLDGSSIRGFVEIYESDLVLKPDPATFAVIPWHPEHSRTARMICDVYRGFGAGRLPMDPRSIAQRA
ncbi:MAG: glutamine synthetase beta-grasp domain-containing protein, partial [Candidatus Bathyarchaeia archaeon]